MKLNKENKRAAGIKAFNDTSRTEDDRPKEFPPELEEYISKLPSGTMNNARKIVRSDFRRILKLPAMTAAKILGEKYGLHLDPDRTAADYGGDPREMSEAEKRFWDGMPPQE